MSKRYLVSLLGGLVLAAALIAPAQAITNGTMDDGKHPMVGALLRLDDDGAGSRGTCTGTLVADLDESAGKHDVFLTAGHCPFADGAEVFVSFEDQLDLASNPDAQDPPAEEGVFHPHPKFVTSNKYDMGVVIFDEDQSATPATLPSFGFLNTAPTTSKFLAVGYGVDLPTSGKGGKTLTQSGFRQYAASSFKSLTSTTLHMTQKIANEEGGSCHGDSGGPVFWGTDPDNTTMIVAIVATGDQWCKSTSINTRMDTQIARDFLDDYEVPLP